MSDGVESRPLDLAELVDRSPTPMACEGPGSRFRSNVGFRSLFPADSPGEAGFFQLVSPDGRLALTECFRSGQADGSVEFSTIEGRRHRMDHVALPGGLRWFSLISSAVNPAAAEDSPPLAFFTSGILHQLRNQLTVLMNSSYTLGRALKGRPLDTGSGIDANFEAEVLERATVEIQDASELLEAYADFMATEHSRVEATDPGLVVERLERLVSHTFMRQGVKLQIGDVPSRLIVLDGALLREVVLQVLRVLVPREQGVERAIRLELFEEERYLGVRVALELKNASDEERGVALSRVNEIPALRSTLAALEAAGGRATYRPADSGTREAPCLEFYFARCDRPVQLGHDPGGTR